MDAFHQAISLMMGNKITTIFFFYIITSRAAGRERKKKKSDLNILSTSATHCKGAFEIFF